MSQPFDIDQFPDLLPEVVKAFEAQGVALESGRFEASVERAARLHEQAAVVELTGSGLILLMEVLVFTVFDWSAGSQWFFLHHPVGS